MSKDRPELRISHPLQAIQDILQTRGLLAPFIELDQDPVGMRQRTGNPLRVSFNV